MGPRERTSMPGTVSRTSAKEGAPVCAASSAPMTAKARGANSGVTSEKPPVTAAGFNAVVSTVMADCAFAFVANTALNAHATRREG